MLQAFANSHSDHHKLTFYYYAETYVNFNALVADLFKQYKIRIWMSAVNPASVVNPNGQTQIQPPSAIGPGAIVHTRTPNAPSSAPVGGFGNNAFRTEQYGMYMSNLLCRPSTNSKTGSNRGRRPQGNTYDDGHFAFSQQLPQYPLQQNAYQQTGYPMQYGHQHMYGRPAYPNTAGAAGGSPMPYDGGFYPPATYSASPAFNNASSAPAFRGGYPAATSAPYAASNVGGTTYYGTAPSSGAAGAGKTATFDPASALEKLSFGN